MLEVIYIIPLASTLSIVNTTSFKPITQEVLEAKKMNDQNTMECLH